MLCKGAAQELPCTAWSHQSLEHVKGLADWCSCAYAQDVNEGNLCRLTSQLAGGPADLVPTICYSPECVKGGGQKVVACVEVCSVQAFAEILCREGVPHASQVAVVGTAVAVMQVVAGECQWLAT